MPLIKEFDGLTLSHAACVCFIYILSLSREGENGGRGLLETGISLNEDNYGNVCVPEDLSPQQRGLLPEDN